MKQFLLSILILIQSAMFAQNIDTTFDGKGNIFSICKYVEVEGVTNSDCIYYYNTGRKFRVGSYIDTNASGTWLSYHKNGALKDSLYYSIISRNGFTYSVLDSFSFYFYGNGAIQERGKHLKDKRQGLWIVYFTDGREKSRVSYVDGLREGEWRVNYRDGKIRESGFYKKDMQVGDWRTYHKNGNDWGLGKYELNKKEGEWVWLYNDGKTVQAKGLFEQNMRLGHWVYNYRNGNVKKAGPFKRGYEEGFWKLYFENGDLQAEGEYILGNKERKWKERELIEGTGKYSEFIYGEYKYDKKDSTWFSYFENGNPKEMWSYIAGEKTGLYKQFYSNGQLKTSWHLVNGRLFQVHGCFTPKGKPFDCGRVKMGSGSVMILDDKGNVIREDYYENGELKVMPEDH